MTNEQKAKKNLEKFKKDFEKLLAKHPGVSVYGDRDGNVEAYVAAEVWQKQASIVLPSSLR
jgi:hypothetical protein